MADETSRRDQSPRTEGGPGTDGYQRILRSVRDLTGGWAAFTYEILRFDNQLYFAEVHAIGPPAFVTTTRALEGRRILDYIGSPGRETWPGDVFHLQRFASVTRAQGRRLGAWGMHWSDAGVLAAHGMTVSDGAAVLGGIVGVRLAGHKPLGRKVRAVLRSAEARLGESFIRACHQQRRAALPPGSESLLVFDDRGSFVASSPGCSPWLDSDARQRIGSLAGSRPGRRESVSFVRRSPVRLRPLKGARTLTVAIVTEGETYRPGPRERLTPAQRAVADCAASGATIDEIARHFGRSPRTVHHHLKSIYSRLGIGCRAELARTLDAAPASTG